MPVPAVHHPDYTFALPPRHPFPMEKFRVLREQLQAFDDDLAWHSPDPIAVEQLAGIHTRSYLDSLLGGTLDRAAQRRSGFEWSDALVRRVRLETGGTLLAARLALEHGLALNAAGGTHHAHADFASGYCLLNDLAVAVRVLLDEGAVSRVLVLDLDVHQGDGTARLLADEPRAFTCSFHAASNFPGRKANSDLDVPLAKGMEDEAYLAELERRLPALLEALQPDLVIYDAGVDVHADDRLGHLSISDQGLLRRDQRVIQRVRSRGVPLAGVIGGGYDRDTEALAARHALLFSAAIIYG